MSEKPKWGSPTGHSVASNETDNIPKCDDTEVMRLWREAGLPEYFLGNGGTNHKLVEFAKLCDLSAPQAAGIYEENMKLRTILSDLLEQYSMLKHKFERAGGVWKVAEKGVELGHLSWASNVENSIVNMDAIFESAKKEIPQEPHIAPVPRLSEQDVVTDETADTERKDDSAYQAGRKQDAPTVEAIREQFENWLTGEGDLPHLKYKNFGGSYITDEACMKWDAYKAGFKAALQNAAE